MHQQQVDSSSVDTELEVSINNAHLLTNLAKAVQDKERSDLNNKLSSDQKKQVSSPEFDNIASVELREDLWLFAYEE